MKYHRTSGTLCIHMVALAVGWSGEGCVPDSQPSVPPCEDPTFTSYPDIPDDLKTPGLQKAVALLDLLDGMWIAVLDCPPLGAPEEREIQMELQGLNSANVRVVTAAQLDAMGASRKDCAPVGSIVVDGTATLSGVEDELAGRHAKCTTDPMLPGEEIDLMCDFGSAQGGEVQNVILSLLAGLDTDAGSYSMSGGTLLFWFAARQSSSGAYSRDFWNCQIHDIRKI